MIQIVYLLLLSSLLLLASGFGQWKSPLVQRSTLLSMSTSPPIAEWYNDAYDVEEIKTWWKKSGAPMGAFGEAGSGRSLLTVGMKGISASHVNSLVQLLGTHKYVRVKLASNKMDPHQIAQDFKSHEALSKMADLLAVKERELMFGVLGKKTRD